MTEYTNSIRHTLKWDLLLSRHLAEFCFPFAFGVYHQLKVLRLIRLYKDGTALIVARGRTNFKEDAILDLALEHLPTLEKSKTWGFWKWINGKLHLTVNPQGKQTF
jgi:hypothetical protein